MRTLGRFGRDLVVEAVWACALTAFALGHVLIGAALSAIGVVQLVLIARGHSGLPFGANIKTSNTSSTGL